MDQNLGALNVTVKRLVNLQSLYVLTQVIVLFTTVGRTPVCFPFEHIVR